VAVTWTFAGVEIAASRRLTWVAVAGTDSDHPGHVRVHVGDPLDGTAVTAQLVAMWERLGLDGFALDPRSPTGTLAGPLQAEGMMVQLADAAGVAKAHGMFADVVAAGKLRVSGHPAIDDAVRGAETRRLAGAAAIDRYADGGSEMAPLLAAELSVWGLGDPETASPSVWVL
jgi:hypothetical protein